MCLGEEGLGGSYARGYRPATHLALALEAIISSTASGSRGRRTRSVHSTRTVQAQHRQGFLRQPASWDRYSERRVTSSPPSTSSSRPTHSPHLPKHPDPNAPRALEHPDLQRLSAPSRSRHRVCFPSQRRRLGSDRPGEGYEDDDHDQERPLPDDPC